MARIVITRPNGETEDAELTTDTAQAGNDRVAVNKDGTTYYAKLDSGVSTHMFVIKPDGRKLYVQKEVTFRWKYVIDSSNKISDLRIPRDGRYKIYVHKQAYNYYGHEIQNTTITKLSKFKAGDHFLNKATKGWYITDTYGFEIYAKKEEVQGDYADDHSRYKRRVETITSIEYVGEA